MCMIKNEYLVLAKDNGTLVLLYKQKIKRKNNIRNQNHKIITGFSFIFCKIIIYKFCVCSLGKFLVLCWTENSRVLFLKQFEESRILQNEHNIWLKKLMISQ